MARPAHNHPASSLLPRQPSSSGTAGRLISSVVYVLVNTGVLRAHAAPIETCRHPHLPRGRCPRRGQRAAVNVPLSRMSLSVLVTDARQIEVLANDLAGTLLEPPCCGRDRRGRRAPVAARARKPSGQSPPAVNGAAAHSPSQWKSPLAQFGACKTQKASARTTNGLIEKEYISVVFLFKFGIPE